MSISTWDCPFCKHQDNSGYLVYCASCGMPRGLENLEQIQPIVNSKGSESSKSDFEISDLSPVDPSSGELIPIKEPEPASSNTLEPAEAYIEETLSANEPENIILDSEPSEPFVEKTVSHVEPDLAIPEKTSTFNEYKPDMVYPSETNSLKVKQNMSTNFNNIMEESAENTVSPNGPDSNMGSTINQDSISASSESIEAPTEKYIFSSEQEPNVIHAQNSDYTNNFNDPSGTDETIVEKIVSHAEPDLAIPDSDNNTPNFDDPFKPEETFTENSSPSDRPTFDQVFHSGVKPIGLNSFEPPVTPVEEAVPYVENESTVVPSADPDLTNSNVSSEPSEPFVEKTSTFDKYKGVDTHNVNEPLGTDETIIQKTVSHAEPGLDIPDSDINTPNFDDPFKPEETFTENSSPSDRPTFDRVFHSDVKPIGLNSFEPRVTPVEEAVPYVEHESTVVPASDADFTNLNVPLEPPEPFVERTVSHVEPDLAIPEKTSTFNEYKLDMVYPSETSSINVKQNMSTNFNNIMEESAENTVSPNGPDSNMSFTINQDSAISASSESIEAPTEKYIFSSEQEPNVIHAQNSDYTNNFNDPLGTDETIVEKTISPVKPDLGIKKVPFIEHKPTVVPASDADFTNLNVPLEPPEPFVEKTSTFNEYKSDMVYPSETSSINLNHTIEELVKVYTEELNIEEPAEKPVKTAVSSDEPDLDIISPSSTGSTFSSTLSQSVEPPAVSASNKNSVNFSFLSKPVESQTQNNVFSKEHSSILFSNQGADNSDATSQNNNFENNFIPFEETITTQRESEMPDDSHSGTIDTFHLDSFFTPDPNSSTVTSKPIQKDIGQFLNVPSSIEPRVNFDPERTSTAFSPRKPRANLIYVLIALILVFGICFMFGNQIITIFNSYFSNSKPFQIGNIPNPLAPSTKCTVIMHEWSRSGNIITTKSSRGEGWTLPPGAEMIRRTDVLDHNEKVLDHYETKETTNRKLVGNVKVLKGRRPLGNGEYEDIYETRPAYINQTQTVKVPIYKSQPVYKTKYVYVVRDMTKKSFSISASDKNPHWPKMAPDCQRANLTEIYTLIVKDPSNYQFKVSVDFTVWQRTNPGDSIMLQKTEDEYKPIE